MAQAFLSSSWYRVAQLKLRLRDHVQVNRHRYRGDAWYVLRDHIGGHTHRLTPAAYAVVGAMDGHKTVDSLWTQAVEALADDAPTQDDLIQLLGQLHSSDLLQGDAPPDSLEAFERFGRQERNRLKQKWLNPTSIRVRLWDPDPFLDRTLWLVRPLFGWIGLSLWLLTVGSALTQVGPNWKALTSGISDHVFAAENLLLIGLIYPIVKALHELGHGYAAKVYGAAVHEMGLMFLVLVPVPYVDASASTLSTSKYHRATVAAAGILVELFLAGVAMHIWVESEPGLVRAIAFNVMLIAGVSTLLFNGNPLLRFDGYYVLADLIEIPNLAGRSNRYWLYLLERYVFRVEGVKTFAAKRGERIWFTAFAPLSFIYRLSVSIGIAIYLAGEFFIIGVLLAIWTIVMSIGVPIGKAAAYVVSSPRLQRNRARAVAISATSLGLVLTGAAFVPAPMNTVTEGVVWIPESAYLRAGTDGFLTTLIAQPGATVQVGQAVATAEDPVLSSRIEANRWRVEELQVRLVAEAITDRAQAEVTRYELAQARAEQDRDQERLERLTAISTTEGIFVAPQANDLAGRYMREGATLGYILPSAATTVRVTVLQDDIDLVRHRLQRVQIKLADRLTETFSARVIREVPSARDELPSKALAIEGGGLHGTDPRDSSGVRTLERLFQFDLELPLEAQAAIFGTRAYVRFDLLSEPLGAQVYRRVRQLFLARFDA